MDRQKVKRDFYLLSGVVLAALLIWGVSLFVHRGEGDRVLVLEDGVITASYPLYEDQTFTIRDSGQDGGYNILMISGGAASISDADCPDKLCVHQRAISHRGESIICLPHRLVISIDSGEEGAVDAVVY